jgi:hypothetical protein
VRAVLLLCLVLVVRALCPRASPFAGTATRLSQGARPPYRLWPTQASIQTRPVHALDESFRESLSSREFRWRWIYHHCLQITRV